MPYFTKYVVCTEKLGLRKIENTKKPYLGSILGLFDKLIHFFNFLDFGSFLKKLMYRLWVKLVKNVRLDGLTRKYEFIEPEKLTEDT